VSVVDGQWSAWTHWSECDVECGGGLTYRNRSCSPPKNGGHDCEGMSQQSQSCNNQKTSPNGCVHVCMIAVHGGWSAWSPWSQCSSDCDSGVQTRDRLCNSPQAQYGGKSCPGPHREDQVCVIGPCDHGGWGPWTNWTECSKSCGGGVRSRRRECDSPTPEGEGNYCEGLGTEAGVLLCDSVPGCHVDGGWSQWSPWAECSMSCGGGVKSRTRLCNNPPAPAHGGRECQGARQETTYCQAPDCPVDGGWSRWSPWSRCDKHCGGGRSIRTRSCSSPPPKNGGKKCEGEKNQVKPCNTKPCGKVNMAQRHLNISWSDCSVTCGRGSQVRSRACINPPPRNNGSDCSGPDRDSQECHKPPCLSVFSFFFKIYTVLSSIW
uniref:Uncharacterized protein n=1 Tax=Periophthalmus magnuspinnatus TaxID=409849 RepID=A0A3B4BCF7_9GOBI